MSPLPLRAQLVVDGATNILSGILTNLGTDLIVGTNLSGASLTIAAGSRITNLGAFIGLNPGAGNNQVTVTGSNSLWLSTGTLTLGQAASGNSLFITGGGLVQAAGAVVGAGAGSTNNLLSIAGGALTVTNSAATGTLDLRGGSLLLNGGNVTVDLLLLTNLGASFTFNAGTIITRGATISNGQAFVVDANPGFGPATWDVRSNTAPTVVAGGFLLGAGVANAVRFNGADQYVAVTNFGAIAPTNEVTVEFWAYASATADQSAFMLEPDDLDNRFQSFISFSDGRTYWDFGDITTSNTLARLSVTNPPGNGVTNWTHYAFVSSQGSNVMRIFRNGSLVASRAGRAPFRRGDYELRIGGSSGYFFNGRIDEFRIWNAALPQAQIQSNLARTLTGTESNLVLYFRFDQTNGTVATNFAAATGADYNGELVNGASWVASDAFLAFATNVDRATLLITNGATLTVSGDAVLGATASSTNNLALIAGPGSTWNTLGSLAVGGAGSFNTLSIANAGVVSSAGGVIGAVAGANQNQVLVNGSGARWTNASGVTVGEEGNGNSLVISNGAAVSSVTGNVGYRSSARANRATVTGSGSIWTAAGELNVGAWGVSNSLQINAGGQVLSGTAYIGREAGANSNQLVVSGAGSQLTLSGILYAGLYGTANTLLVTNGGAVSSAEGYLGYAFNVSGNQAVVAGTGSVWTAGSQLQVGAAGTRNSLRLSGGGRVNSDKAIIGGVPSANNNDVVVNGAGSLWLAGSELRLGNFASFNLLMLTNGGALSNELAYLGFDASAGTNRAVVTGSGSAWTNRTALYVGWQGAGNSLTIQNGGRTVSGSAAVGVLPTATNNRVVVSGAGSLWLNLSNLSIGGAGASNSLLINSGGTVQSGSVFLGASNGAVGNAITVDGGTLSVTNAAGTAVVDIRRGLLTLNAGTLLADRLLLTNAAGTLQFGGGTLVTRGATINNGQTVSIGLIPGTTATWEVRPGGVPTTLSSDLNVGLEAGGARLLVTNGAVLRVGGSTAVGGPLTTSNNLAMVSGPGSVWTNAAVLYVGLESSGNNLLVSNAGRFVSGPAFIGVTPDAAANRLVVSGPGSVWLAGGDVSVGSAGANNSLVVEAAGLVRAPNLIVGAEGGPVDSQASVQSASLFVTNAGTGHLEVRSGMFTLTAGMVTADRLTVTNAGAAFAFESGLLNVGQATFGSGVPLVVGSAGAAVLRLTGATNHSFASGLRIGNSSQLAGGGRVSGSITNAGLFTPGGGGAAGAVDVTGALTLESQARLAFEIGGLIATNQHDQVNVSSFVQFAGTLSLTLLNGFNPQSGDVFTLMRYASRTGTFDGVASGTRIETSNGLGSFVITYNPTSLVASGFLRADADGDGVADAWALQHFQHSPLTPAELAADPDGDGASNYAEFYMGTVPTNAASVLKILSVVPNASGQNVVRFSSVTNRSYFIRCDDSLGGSAAAAFQVDNPSLTSPAPGVSQWVDDGTLTGGLPLPAQRFYRIGVR